MPFGLSAIKNVCFALTNAGADTSYALVATEDISAAAGAGIVTALVSDTKSGKSKSVVVNCAGLNTTAIAIKPLAIDLIMLRIAASTA